MTGAVIFGVFEIAASHIASTLAPIPLRPPSASSIADSVDKLHFTLTAITLFFTVVIFSIIFYFMIKYRRQSEDEVPPEIEKNIPLEILWTAIPTLISVGLFFWSASLYIRNARPPDASTEIFVVGKQWMWHLQHPEGVREINELHVPVGVPVKLTMTSEDVIHDFYVPAFRVKKDVLPGRYTSLWFQATKTGTYHLFCGQYCGAEHAQMIGWVYVMEPADYAAWLSGGASHESMAQAGERLFNQLGCVHVPCGRQQRARPLARGTLRQAGKTSQRRISSGRRSSDSPGDRVSEFGDPAELPADHAHFSGTD